MARAALTVLQATAARPWLQDHQRRPPPRTRAASRLAPGLDRSGHEEPCPPATAAHPPAQAPRRTRHRQPHPPRPTSPIKGAPYGRAVIPIVPSCAHEYLSTGTGRQPTSAERVRRIRPAPVLTIQAVSVGHNGRAPG